jgi:chromosome segregation ATPase
MTEDLASLIEQHQKDIWEWKQKESQWIRDKNQLDGNKRIIEELSTKIVDLTKRAQEAEGETTIVKGIGMNSPEMRAAQAKIKELESTLASAQDINDNHQRYNGKLQTRLTEVEGDNKRLAQQVNDYREQLRKAGF